MWANHVYAYLLLSEAGIVPIPDDPPGDDVYTSDGKW